MSDFLIKEATRLRWRSKKWLLVILGLELIFFLTFFRNDLWLFLTIPITYIVWLIVNYWDILYGHHKIAVAIEADSENKEAISRARRMIDRIEIYFNSNNKNSNLVKIYPLDINRLKSVDDARRYLGRWHNKFDSIIFAEIDCGQTNGKEVFVINQFSIVSKYLGYEVKLNGILVNLKQDLRLIEGSAKFKYLIEDELIGKELVISSLNKLLLYYAALCLLCQRRLDDSLFVFKSIFEPSQTRINTESGTPLPKEITLTADQVFHVRIKTIITEIYRQIIGPKMYDRSDSSKVKILQEAIQTLEPAPLVYDLKVLLAKTFYEIGNRNEAEKITSELETINGLTDEVLLNKGFFAILDGNTSKLYQNYSKLNRPHRTDGVGVVAFLHEEKDKFPEQSVLFEFAIAKATFLYVDANSGKELLKAFISKTQNVEKVRKLREHFIEFLKPKISKPQARRR
jgi:tetratricopeptide (TPR) repeat protein